MCKEFLSSLLVLLLCLHLSYCIPIDDEPLSAAGQALLQSAARAEAVTPSREGDGDRSSVTTVSTSGVPHITGRWRINIKAYSARLMQPGITASFSNI